MNYRTIIEDGTRVSTLALGGNLFGYACDEPQAREIIHAAENLGVNFLDTADVYSQGRSEEIIGQALAGRRDRWVIATKVGVQSGGTGHGIGSRALIIERIEGSLRRLRTDYIDIYQLHHFDPVTPPVETLETFEILREQGKVRHFGLSNCTADQAGVYCEAARVGGLTPPATNQVHYNLLKRQTETEFPDRSGSNYPRLLIYGALGRGILSGKYRAGEKPAANTRAAMSERVQSDLQPDLLAAVAELSHIATAAGVTMSQLAMAYVLRHRAVASTIIGVRTLAQLKEVADACTLTLGPLSWAEVDAFLRQLHLSNEVSLGQPAFPLNASALTPFSSV